MNLAAPALQCSALYMLGCHGCPGSGRRCGQASATERVPPRGIGRTIDRIGGRQVLSLSNLILAAGLTLLGLATSIWLLAAARLLIDVMGARILIVSSALSLAALLALCLLRQPSAAT